MDNEALKQQITSWEPAAEFSEEGSQFLEAIITPQQLMALAEKLRTDESTDFDYMFCLTCVDFPEHFMMVYHLRSMAHKHEMVLKVRELAGSTNPEEAEATSIRGSYGRITTKGIYENVLHASTNKEEAEREIKLWFEPDQVIVNLYPTKNVDIDRHKKKEWA